MNDDAFYFPGEMRQSGHFTGMPCLMVPLSEHQAAQEFRQAVVRFCLRQSSETGGKNVLSLILMAKIPL
jgi:hypothetical protein